MNLTLVFFGLVGLFLGGNMLVDGSSRLARSLATSPLIVGLTIVTLGTSAPDLLIALQAAADGVPDVSVGAIVGANIANVGLIMAIAGLLSTLSVSALLIKRGVPLLIFVTISVYLMFLLGGIGQALGFTLLGAYVLFNLIVAFFQRDEPRPARRYREADERPVNRWWEVLRILLGVVFLVVGSSWTIDGALAIAGQLGISGLVMGTTFLAIAVSLPELAAVATAAQRGESDLAVGNLIGSNIANLTFVLGTTSALFTISIDWRMNAVIYPFMIAFTLLMVPFGFDRRLSRRESFVYLLVYVVFLVFVFQL